MIRAGYLVDLRGLRVRLAVDFSRVRVSHGYFVDADAAAALTVADAPAHACAAYLEHAPGRKALLFTPTVELAHLMAEAFRKRGVAAEAVDGSLPLEERRAILTRLRSGETKVVANCAVLTEGFDEPSVDCVIVALVGATERHDLLTLPQLFGLGDATALEDRTVTEALERDQAAAAPVPLAAPLVAEEVDLFRER